MAIFYLIAWPVVLTSGVSSKDLDPPWLLLVILTIVGPFLFGLVYGLPAGILDGLLLGKHNAETKQPILSHPRHHSIKRVSIYFMTYGAIGGLFSLLGYLLSSELNWPASWTLVITFSMLGLIPGFRSAKRTFETDIRTTNTLPWSWEKSGRAYMIGTVLLFSFLAIWSAIDFVLSNVDLNTHLSVSFFFQPCWLR